MMADTRMYMEWSIQGFTVPVIIPMNGSPGVFQFSDLQVYEDGRVDCGGLTDLAHFSERVQDGQIAVGIPENGVIIIPDTGSFTITGAAWQFTPATFTAYITSLVNTLNPEMKGLYTYSDQALHEQVQGSIYKEDINGFEDEYVDHTDMKGESLNMFYLVDGVYHLVKVVLFPDRMVHLNRLETPVKISLAELDVLIEQGELVSQVPVHAHVQINGMGSFTVQQVNWFVLIEDKQKTIGDIFTGLTDYPGSLWRCQAAYDRYMQHPTLANRQALKEAYESVPEYFRFYLADKYTRNYIAEIIIYGYGAIEKWLRYKERMGMQTVQVVIPWPVDA